MRAQFLLIAGVVLAGNTSAHAATPAGVWKTVDDETHEVRSLVEISDDHGVLSGRVVKLFPRSGEDPNPRCGDCEGERHGQPVLGMTILWNMHRDGDAWDGGEILDPEEGKTYRCTLHLDGGGNRLEVRGYVGVALFGRTQVWLRATD